MALNFTNWQIERMLNIPIRTQVNIKTEALKRGWTEHSFKIEEEYVQARKPPGRPPTIGDATKQQAVDSISQDRASREQTVDYLAYKLNISKSAVHRIIQNAGYSKVKPTTKPGLSKKQKLARLLWCLLFKDLTLEEFKRLAIWTDETAVVIGMRRGKIRLWRLPNEAFEESCIRRRWKGFTTFMFWGCISTLGTGPCHIYRPLNAKTRKAMEEIVEQLNIEREPELRQQWELVNAAKRIHIDRNQPGARAQWKFNAANGKLVLQGKDGNVDWYRHWQEIYLPRLIPYWQRLQQQFPDIQVMEDGAGPHIHHFCQEVLRKYNIPRLDWPGNSPDLNPIEKVWWYLKRVTTAHGPCKTRAELERRWIQAWKSLTPERINMYIEGCWRNIQKVIELDGGNEYKEGRESKREYKGLRVKGMLPAHAYLNQIDSSLPGKEETWELMENVPVFSEDSILSEEQKEDDSSVSKSSDMPPIWNRRLRSCRD